MSTVFLQKNHVCINQNETILSTLFNQKLCVQYWTKMQGTFCILWCIFFNTSSKWIFISIERSVKIPETVQLAKICFFCFFFIAVAHEGCKMWPWLICSSLTYVPTFKFPRYKATPLLKAISLWFCFFLYIPPPQKNPTKTKTAPYASSSIFLSLQRAFCAPGGVVCTSAQDAVKKNLWETIFFYVMVFYKLCCQHVFTCQFIQYIPWCNH